MVVWDRPAEPGGGKPRTRRVVLGAAALVAGVVAVLVVANWGTVRDHVEAWHFQLRTKTETILPGPHLQPEDMLSKRKLRRDCRGAAEQLASATGTAVVINHLLWGEPVLWEPADSHRPSAMGERELMLSILRSAGYRVLEQRFPRRAYVVLHDPRSMLALPFGMEREPPGCQAARP